jgi:transcription termination factor Rho
LSDTTDVTSDVSGVGVADNDDAAGTRRRRTGSGLSSMLLPELQSLASSLGISGTARMRKGELVAAITERQGGGRVAAARVDAPRAEVRADVPDERPVLDEPVEVREPRRATRPAGPPPPRSEGGDNGERADTGRERVEAGERAEVETGERTERRDRRDRNDRGDRAERNGDRSDRAERTGERAERGGDRNDRPERADRGDRTNDRGDRGERDRDNRRNREDRTGERAATNDRVNASADAGDDDEDGGRRGRRSRFRDRRRGGRGERSETAGSEPQVTEDDVLIPVAGIVDVMDNYAFIRTTGYLSGPNDVYVSMSQVKRYGLRRGDAVTGAVRAGRGDETGSGRRDKYNPLVRLDTVNGMDPEEARRRPEFYKLTPLYPQERLRLETEPHILTTRVIDLVMPIGKGQRALIVSPPKAGKTMVLQAIANAITHNNPECHLMVVLVDERPEEVTDMQRSVKGEVIASTFDRPPQDHTTVAELAIERAKRLVELGHDVVVLLDSITRLGRAYNLAAPASGRILSGGIDSTALYPPKRFLGAARNIENGGSITIIATALVETGSLMDTVIFEEFKGTGNAELRLDRKIADKRVFPAIDIDPSSTRKEEILLAPEELAIIIKLRKVLHSLESQQAIDLLLDRLKKTRTNIEFLMQIAQSTPGE